MEAGARKRYIQITHPPNDATSPPGFPCCTRPQAFCFGPTNLAQEVPGTHTRALSTLAWAKGCTQEDRALQSWRGLGEWWPDSLATLEVRCCELCESLTYRRVVMPLLPRRGDHPRSAGQAGRHGGDETFSKRESESESERERE